LAAEAKTLRASTSCARLRPNTRFSVPQSYVLNSCSSQREIQVGQGGIVRWPLQCLAGAVITQPSQQAVGLQYVILNLVLLRWLLLSVLLLVVVVWLVLLRVGEVLTSLRSCTEDWRVFDSSSQRSHSPSCAIITLQTCTADARPQLLSCVHSLLCVLLGGLCLTCLEPIFIACSRLVSAER
jgi:hypothetical protein